MKKSELQAALLDVRKAYCLLADYQQRLIELLTFIKNQLDAEHYYHDRQYHYDSRALHNIYTDPNAGIKFLPLIDFHLLWHRTKHIPENTEWQNHIQHNDLVFDIYIVDSKIKNFGTLEKANSEMRLYIYQCIKYKRKNDWFTDVWRKSVYPEYFGEVLNWKDENGEMEYNIYGESFDLADLYNEAAVCEALDAFRKRASEKLNQEI